MPQHTSIDAYSFAQSLIARVRSHLPEAAALRPRKGRDGADIGIEDDGEFEAVFRVKNGSKAGNVMSLWVYLHEQWQPTFIRGTPAEIAEKLTGPFAYLWQIPVIAMGFTDLESSGATQPTTPRRRTRPSK